jgi:outer membrane lipoprotein-sorting protein
VNRDCRRTRDDIADLLAGMLAGRQARALEEHLAQCSTCRDYARALTEEDRWLTDLFAQVDAHMTYQQERVIGALARAGTARQMSNPGLGRIIMKNKRPSLVAAAVLVAAALIGTYAFVGSGNGTGVVWGAVVQNLQNCRTITWKEVDLAGTEPVAVAQFWVREPDCMRCEQADGTIVLSDRRMGTTTFVYPAEMKIVIGPEPPAQEIAGRYDAFRTLIDKPGLIVQEAGRREIDGKETIGFRLTHAYDLDRLHGPMLIWIDPQTELPTRLEFLEDRGGELRPIRALTEITFDLELDESLFEINPEGYQVEQVEAVYHFFNPHSIENAAHIEQPK